MVGDRAREGQLGLTFSIDSQRTPRNRFVVSTVHTGSAYTIPSGHDSPENIGFVCQNTTRATISEPFSRKCSRRTRRVSEKFGKH